MAPVRPAGVDSPEGFVTPTPQDAEAVARSEVRGRWAEAVNSRPDFDAFEAALDLYRESIERRVRAEMGARP